MLDGIKVPEFNSDMVCASLLLLYIVASSI